jgi:hypothetical protein
LQEERRGVAEEACVVLVLEQDVLQGVPVVVGSRGREFGLQVGDEFDFVVVQAFGILDRQVEGDLLGGAGWRGMPADLEIGVEVIECAGAAAQESLVQARDAGMHGAQRPRAPEAVFTVRTCGTRPP